MNVFDIYNYLEKRVQEEENSLIQEARSPKSYWITQGLIVGFKEILAKIDKEV